MSDVLEYKIILGSAAGLLTLGAHIPYFLDVLKGRTKPHIFTWLIWTLLLSIGIAAQLSKGAGFGAWSTIGDAVATGAIFLCCFKYGEKNITRSDKITFGFALVGVVLWVITSDPLWAVIFAVIADAFGFFPTFRKSFNKPHEETALTYLIVVVGYLIGLFSLQAYSLTTVLYPAYLVIGNGSLWIYLLMRRKQMKNHA